MEEVRRLVQRVRITWALMVLAAAPSQGIAQAMAEPKPAAWFCGNVVDEDGQPLWHPMKLYTLPVAGPSDKETYLWAFSKGHFRQGPIAPGRYWLAIDLQEPEKRWPVDVQSQSSGLPCERWVQIRLTPSGPQFEWHTRDDGWVDAGTEEANTLPRLCGKLNRSLSIRAKKSNVADYKMRGLREMRIALYARKSGLRCCAAGDFFSEVMTRRGGKFEFKKVPMGAYWLVTIVEGKNYVLPVRLQRRKSDSEKLCSDNTFAIDDEGRFSLWETVYLD